MVNSWQKRKSHRRSLIAASSSAAIKSTTLRSNLSRNNQQERHQVSIHPTAIVSTKAELGRNVHIGPYSIIGDDVILHDDVRVESHSVIEGPSEFGSGTIFFPFVSAGQAPHDLKYEGERSWLRA